MGTLSKNGHEKDDGQKCREFACEFGGVAAAQIKDEKAAKKTQNKEKKKREDGPNWILILLFFEMNRGQVNVDIDQKHLSFDVWLGLKKLSGKGGTNE